MRKRKAVRPVLESMEGRLVLSLASALNPIAGISSAIAALSPAHHSRDAAAHHSKAEVPGKHQHTTKAAHAVHSAHPAHHHSASSSSNSGSTVSSFLKSVFPGL
jgi:hypothetical protein